MTPNYFVACTFMRQKFSSQLVSLMTASWAEIIGRDELKFEF
jgi:hypothetical protein